ncbi:hypothetical protein BCE02nite_20820 [Brevibacillus centrosporus]|nr:hypothetical protein BCE02nite_20820 [Brevibacillus centrosporus]
MSGVGFLGAGMIFMQRQTVKGLTTAAGIWATAGMGMAIGAGLYTLGIGTTILVLVAQKVTVKLPGSYEIAQLLPMLQRYAGVRAVEVQ